MTEIPREPQQAQALVPRREVAQHLPRAVGRAVVDEHDLVLADRGQHEGESAPELLDRVALVEDGGDDGEHDLKLRTKRRRRKGRRPKVRAPPRPRAHPPRGRRARAARVRTTAAAGSTSGTGPW